MRRECDWILPLFRRDSFQLSSSSWMILSWAAWISSDVVHFWYCSKKALERRNWSEHDKKKLVWLNDQIVPIDFVEWTTPSKRTEHFLSIGVESGDIKSSGESFYTVKSPWFSVVGWISCDEIWYWLTLSTSAKCDPEIAMNAYRAVRGDWRSY